jgi:hypothetical protein
MQLTELKLNNPGILMGKLPCDVFDVLKSNVDQAIENKTSKAHDLVGMIEELYAIQLDVKVQSHLYAMTQHYQDRFNFKRSHRPVFTNPWVNVQKKHEFSPVHHHPRTLGWVVWVKIPYELQNEMSMPNSANSRVKKNSNFEFVYSNLGGEIQTHNIAVDKSYEGTVMMFPSYLRHTVYPFYTSDDYRISVAGNIDLVK